jgi:cell division protein FtsB
MRSALGRFGFVLPFGLLLLALVAVPLRILESEGLPRYRALRAELRELRLANAATRRELRALKRQVERLRRDLSAIERIARDELGMLREGEVLFHFRSTPGS